MSNNVEKDLAELKELFSKGLISEDIYNQRQMDILQKAKNAKRATAGDIESTSSEGKPYVAPPVQTYSQPYVTPVIKTQTTYIQPVVPMVSVTPGYNPDPGYDDRPVPRSPRKCNCFCDFGCIDVGTPNWGCGKWTVWVFALLFILAAQAVGVLIGIVNLITLFSSGPLTFFSVDDDAKGFIAIGQTATGFIAIGQFATGFLTIGQLTYGFINLSMLGVGILANCSMVGGSIGVSVGILQIGGFIPAAVVGLGLIYVRRAILGVNIIAPFFHTEDGRKFVKAGCK